MAVARHIADKSAFEQQRHSDAADGLLRALAADGALHMTEIVALELLYSARSPADYTVRWDGLASLPWLPMSSEVATTALDLQRRLATEGQHRRPIPDLLVAATALVHDATVLHYDRDFDLIAEVSDLSARWIIPAGTGHGASPGR
ncbi:MAG TPA: PIN domain-containing protein [Iamia sp.]|jgi:predicted nucleic acid-binding protein|nr:PIN domain-containing protein [Iamia sp.]